MWKDRAFAPQAAEALNLTARKLLELKVADDIILEPVGGAHSDPAKAIAEVGKAIAAHLKQLAKLDGEELKRQRYEKFRAMGTLLIAPAAAETDRPAPAKKAAAAAKTAAVKTAAKTTRAKSAKAK